MKTIFEIYESAMSPLSAKYPSVTQEKIDAILAAKETAPRLMSNPDWFSLMTELNRDEVLNSNEGSKDFSLISTCYPWAVSKTIYNADMDTFVSAMNGDDIANVSTDVFLNLPSQAVYVAFPDDVEGEYAGVFASVSERQDSELELKLVAVLNNETLMPLLPLIFKKGQTLEQGLLLTQERTENIADLAAFTKLNILISAFSSLVAKMAQRDLETA